MVLKVLVLSSRSSVRLLCKYVGRVEIREWDLLVFVYREDMLVMKRGV